MDYAAYYRSVGESAAWLRSRISVSPRVVVVLSAGLDSFIDGIEKAETIPSSEIPNFPRAKTQGHSGNLVFGRAKGVPVVALAGRFHFYEGHSPMDVIFPYFVLAALGAKVVIATNAVGGIDKNLNPGDLMLVTDHINMMGFNPLVGIATQRPQGQFTDMANAYDPELREIALRVAKAQGFKLKQGVYLAVSGPSYETKAEIRAFRTLGASAVGMSTVPEVIAANFLGMKVLCLSCVANAAADLHEGAISHDEVLAAMNALAPRAVKLLHGVVESLSTSNL